MSESNPPSPAAFMVQCAELNRSINAVQDSLCRIAASGIAFESINDCAELEEVLRKARTILCRASFAVCNAMHVAAGDITLPPPDPGDEWKGGA